MVSNDDIIIQSSNSALQNIKYTDSLGALYWSWEWAVPIGKIWSLKRVLGTRDSGTGKKIIIRIYSPVNSMMLKSSNTDFQEYEPMQELILPAGWSVYIFFEGDISTSRRVYLTVDERNEY